MIARIRADRYGSADGSLDGAILWSALFIFGPGMLWLSVAWVVFDQVTAWAAGFRFPICSRPPLLGPGVACWRTPCWPGWSGLAT